SSQGGEMKKITQDLFPFISSLCWSPNGSHLAFHTSSYTSDSLHNGIWLVSSKGENEYFISNDGEHFPLWLTDNLIVGCKNVVLLSNINVVTISNFQLDTITPKVKQQWDIRPVWFNDDDRIAFERNNQIWITSYFSKKDELLIDENGYNLSISPGGIELLYDNRQDIFLKNLDNGTTVNLSKDILDNLCEPVWSSDGKKIACVSTSGLHIFRIDSLRLSEEMMIPGIFYNICWSTHNPKFGSHIAYDDGNSIYMVTPPGTHEIPLIFDATEPCWSPNGLQLAYVRWNQIFIQNIFEDIDAN
ncbi:MAG: PD40 domain-containing protein, partial [bacterium]